MEIRVEVADALSFKTEAMVFGIFDDLQLDNGLRKLDFQLGNAISNMIQAKQIKGDANTVTSVTMLDKAPFGRLTVVGLGKKDSATLETLRRASSMAALHLRGAGVKEFATTLHNVLIADTVLEERSSAVVEGALLGLYQYLQFKTQELDKINKVEKLTLISDEQLKPKIQAGTKEAETVCNYVNLVRDLVNRPSSNKIPAVLADEIRQLARDAGIDCKVLNKDEIKKLGMNAFLAVNKGSSEEPKLVILDYNSKAPDSVALVGKGITFDSGGINLKPTNYIETMKLDMAGAATVLGAILCAAKLQLPLRVIGVMPFTENMPGGSATKPGDIVKSFNGKTIEIMNTDAEGRLILSDALAYTEKTFQPNAIVDLATLTGAVKTALGRYFVGTLGTDDKLVQKLNVAGKQTGEWIWQLPLVNEHQDYVKGELADVKNVCKYSGEAGVISGAVFLKNFIEKTPWVHLDIACVAWQDEFDLQRPYLQKGATGIGVRLIVELLKKWKTA